MEGLSAYARLIYADDIQTNPQDPVVIGYRIERIAEVLLIFLLILPASSDRVEAEENDHFEIIALGKHSMTTQTGATVIAEHVEESGIPSRALVLGADPDLQWHQDPRIWHAGWDRLFWRLRKADSDSFVSLVSFENALIKGFDPSFLTIDAEDLVYRLGLGWVWYNEDEVLPVNACGSPGSWPRSHCIESDDDQHFIVKMKVGHPGFSILEVAANLHVFQQLSDENKQVQLERIDDFAEKALADRLAKHWLLTAIDIGRTVEFWLYQPNDTEPYRKATGEKAKPGPLVTTDKTKSGTRNTCGGDARACPIFFDPENSGEWSQLDEIMNSLPGDWIK